MKGIQKLKVPVTEVTPKLFVLIMKYEGEQHHFQKVAFCLEDAIKKCYYFTHQFTIHEYIVHDELSIDQINNLFRFFNP